MLPKLSMLFIALFIIVFTKAQVVINNTSSPSSSTAKSSTSKKSTKKKKTTGTNKKKSGAYENLKIVYVVQVMSSSDRDLVYSNKAKLYQMYPLQRVYVSSEPPFYKLRLGFFTTKDKATKYRNQIGSAFGMEAYVVKDKVKINTIKIIKPNPNAVKPAPEVVKPVTSKTKSKTKN
jgi:SPOR domain